MAVHAQALKVIIQDNLLPSKMQIKHIQFSQSGIFENREE